MPPDNLLLLMRGLNKTTPVGTPDAEPDYQQLEGNAAVAKFALATTKADKDRNGKTQYNTKRSAVAVAADCAHESCKKNKWSWLLTF